MRDRARTSLETIARTRGKEVSDVLGSEKFGQTCYCTIAAVSLKYEGRYLNARNALNRIIIAPILANKNRQSSRRYANMIDWTALLNQTLLPESLPVSAADIEAARVTIDGAYYRRL